MTRRRPVPSKATAARAHVSRKTVYKHAAKPDAQAIKDDPEKLAAFIKEEQKKDNRLQSSDVIRQAKDALAVYRAKMAKLDFDKAEGRLIDKDTVEMQQRAFVQTVTAGVLNMHTTLALLVAGKSVQDCETEIRAYGRRMLESWKKLARKDGEP